MTKQVDEELPDYIKQALKMTPLTLTREWLAGRWPPPPPNPVVAAIREFTIDWLAERLAAASGAAFPDARHALTVAISEADRSVLDDGEAFILAVDQAAITLDCDPWLVSLRPQRLNS